MNKWMIWGARFPIIFGSTPISCRVVHSILDSSLEINQISEPAARFYSYCFTNKAPSWVSYPMTHPCIPRDPMAHRTSSEDDEQGVDPITETKRFLYLGSMKPFTEGDWIPRDWYIYLHSFLVDLYGIHVGKYTSPSHGMRHGYRISLTHSQVWYEAGDDMSSDLNPCLFAVYNST